MSAKVIVKLAVVPAVAALAIVVALPVRGRDNDKQYQGTVTCDVGNADYAKDEFPASKCLEGHGCVFCYLIGGNPIGEQVGLEGSGKRQNATSHDCGGQRRIGVCSGSGGTANCDLSTYYIEGDCGGAVNTYEPQPIPPL